MWADVLEELDGAQVGLRGGRPGAMAAGSEPGSERQQRAAVAAAKAAERQRREDHVARQKADGERRTAQLNARVHDLESLLRSGLSRTAHIDLGSLKRAVPQGEFNLSRSPSSSRNRDGSSSNHRLQGSSPQSWVGSPGTSDK
jgi:hypothetical protein